MHPLTLGLETDLDTVNVIDIFIGINLFQLGQNLINQRLVREFDAVLRDVVLRVCLLEL